MGKTWSDFEKRINQRHGGLANYLAYAVGIARNDKNSMNHAFASIGAYVEDNDRFKNIIRDIDGVGSRIFNICLRVITRVFRSAILRIT